MSEDLTEKQMRELDRIKNAGDFSTIAEVKRAAATIGIRVLLKDKGLKPLPIEDGDNI
jgi:hypothetical protein